jgi:hypothetical protein
MFTLKFFVSGFSYPPKEGLHANMANTLNVFGEHLQKRGGEILFFAFCKRKKDVDLDQIQAKHSNLHIKFAFKAMPLRYPTLLLVFTLLPRFVCRRFIGLGKASPSLIFIDGIPLSPLLKAKTEIPTIMSAVDAWSLRQHRLAKQSSGFKKLFLKSLYG